MRAEYAFNVIRDGRALSCLGWAQGKKYGYEAGYRKAADVLYREIAQTERGLETLLFPLCYVWRHSIELQLKRIIADCANLQEEDVPAHLTHDLVKLWRIAKPQLVAMFSEEPVGADIVERLLAEIQSLDPENTGFRYPQDRNGKPNLCSVPEHFDVHNFHEVCTEIASFLECASMEISVRLDHLSDMLREMA